MRLAVTSGKPNHAAEKSTSLAANGAVVGSRIVHCIYDDGDQSDA